MRCTVCLREVGRVRRLSDLKDRGSLRARICGRVSEVPSSWNRLCKTVSRNAYYGSVIIVFIVMSSGSPTSQLLMPELPRLYTQTLRGAEGRVPWRPALRGGAPNKFCASRSRLCCGGGAAMWGGILRTTFPIIPFTAATLAGGRWLPWVWPFRPPGRFCSSPFWASTMGGAGSLRVGRQGRWATPARFFHSFTLGTPLHVSVRAEKPARPPLAKGRRTQTSGVPHLLAGHPPCTQCPLPSLSRRPVFASVMTEY